jgi:anti-sigma regulatory factor (Ser/Thr protein kinase)
MTLELYATPHEVMRAVETLQKFGREHGYGEKELFGVALALEECGSNIVNYALGRDAQKRFFVQMEHADDTISLELRDAGPEFDPTAARQRERSAHDDDLPGGWGIQLVRQHIDEIQYRREAGQNILNLKKKMRTINCTKS